MVTREVYDMVMDCYGGMCAECLSRNSVEIHHKLANTKVNRRKYPLFLNSPFNLVCLCGNMANGCHEKFKHKYKVVDREADLYECYLEELQDAN